MRLGFVVIVAYSALAVPCQGQEVVLDAVRADAPPILDGALRDPVWTKAVPIEGFFSQRYGRPISERTTAWIAYDDTHVYAAFYCYGDPARIRAFQRKRGGSFSRDDHVALMLDTFCSGGPMYKFYVNPLGTQDDSMPGGSAANVRWRGDWEAAARIVDDGWVAEMAVPFSILRYPEGQRQFQVSLSRTIHENLETAYWPAEAYLGDARGACIWKGLELSSPRRPWYVMPYGALDWRATAADAYFGVDVKKNFASGLSLALTYNPDFGNIEGDVVGLDFSYVEKAVAETRPFFLEGSGYFPDRKFFYTQRVGEVDFGAKLFGKLGDAEIGFLDAVSPDSRNDAVLSLGYDLTEVFDVHLDAVMRAESGLTNTVGNVELSARQFSGAHEYVAVGGYGLSGTEGESSGHAAYFQVSRSRPRGITGVSVSLKFEEISPDFNAMSGFVPEKDIRGGFGYAGYSQAYDCGKIEDWYTSLTLSQYDRTDGDFFHRDIQLKAGMDFRDWLGFSLGYFGSNRSVTEKTHHDGVWSVDVAWNRHSYRKQGALKFDYGRRASQDYLFASLKQEFLWSDKFSLEGRLQHRILSGDTTDEDSQGIFSFNYDFTPEIGISGRVVATQSNTNGYLAYKQRTRKGLDLFVSVGDPNAEEFTERVAVKLTVCLEI